MVSEKTLLLQFIRDILSPLLTPANRSHAILDSSLTSLATVSFFLSLSYFSLSYYLSFCFFLRYCLDLFFFNFVRTMFLRFFASILATIEHTSVKVGGNGNNGNKFYLVFFSILASLTLILSYDFVESTQCSKKSCSRNYL